MGVALSAKYFLFVQRSPLEDKQELRPAVLVRGVYTRETFGVSGLGQIWDAKKGDVVWEGVGVGGFGEMTCFSFYPAKNLGVCGESGVITTNNETYYKHLQSLRNHGSSEKYYHDEVGYN